MRYCWSHSDNDGNVLTVGVVLIWCLGFAEIIAVGESSVEHIIKWFLILSVLSALPLFLAFVSARKYRITANGIEIMYPFRIKDFFYWEKFNEIAVCKIHYASGNAKHILAIRCSLSERTSVPRNATSSRAWWTSMMYELVFFKELISIYYTDVRYEEFQRFSPIPIKDYQSMKD